MFERSHPSGETGAAEPTVRKTIFGRFMLPDSSEHGCQVSNISMDGATFIAGIVPDRGQPLVAYLEQLGRLEATAGDPVDGGFRVTFDLTGMRRERLSTRLGWLGKERTVDKSEERQFVRRELADGQSQITLPDGRTYPCRVLDISLSGAGIQLDVLPALGAMLSLGKMQGKVVRHTDMGIGIQFATILRGEQLSTVVQVRA